MQNLIGVGERLKGYEVNPLKGKKEKKNKHKFEGREKRLIALADLLNLFQTDSITQISASTH